MLSAAAARSSFSRGSVSCALLVFVMLFLSRVFVSHVVVVVFLEKARGKRTAKEV